MPERNTNSNGRRKSALDLAPLERECMSALWPLGEATVRDIREVLLPVRPRAYTTIMTIMDRLAHKGVVTRRKSGRAYVYRAAVSAEEARARAVGQLVENFFGGSPAALVSHLTGAAQVGDGAMPVRASLPAIGAGANVSSRSAAPRNVSRSANRQPEAADIDETLL